VSTESLNCPNCGAPLLDALGKTTVVCDHCGSVIALKLPTPPPPASAPAQPPAPRREYREPSPERDPTYEYGQVPQGQLARSELTSVALGPADAAEVIQLLRGGQVDEATRLYQSKTNSSRDEAQDAISAIQAGLSDASAPLAAGKPLMADPASLPDVLALVRNGDANGAIRAYQAATGVDLRSAQGRIDSLNRRLRAQAEAAAHPQPPPPAKPARRAGCPVGCLMLVLPLLLALGAMSALVLR
jgi:hypothetical protein